MAVFRILCLRKYLLESKFSAAATKSLSRPEVFSCIASNDWGVLNQLCQPKIRTSHTQAATSIIDNKSETQNIPERDDLDLTFSDARQAFRSKSTLEIIRAYLVFKLCSIHFLVDHNEKVNLLLHPTE